VAELKLGRLDECEASLTHGLSLAADDKFLLETQKLLKEEKAKKQNANQEKEKEKEKEDSGAPGER
jgi:hypothetical protein